MRDDWYGHRDPITFSPAGDKDEWLDWDHALVDALQTIEDYSDQYGLLAWELADPHVEVDAVKKIHPFEAARDRQTQGSANKPYKPEPGEYFLPDVWTRNKDGLQDYGTWITKMAEEQE